MQRTKYHQSRLLLRAPLQIERAIAALRAAPLDPFNPLEFLIREEVKERKLMQQGLMWAGPLKDTPTDDGPADVDGKAEEGNG